MIQDADELTSENKDMLHGMEENITGLPVDEAIGCSIKRGIQRRMILKETGNT